MQEQEAAQGEGSEHDIDDVDVNNAAVSNLDIRSFASKSIVKIESLLDQNQTERSFDITSKIPPSSSSGEQVPSSTTSEFNLENFFSSSGSKGNST